MNIDTALKNAVFELKKNKISTALLDSEILMSKVLEKDRKYVILNSKDELNEKNYLSFQKLIMWPFQSSMIFIVTKLFQLLEN